MIHITKTKSGKFQVVYLAANGEVLATSELLSSKQKAWGNIRAVRNRCFDWTGSIFVQDDTLDTPVVCRFWGDGSMSRIEGRKPRPKYVPGRNR